MSRGRRLPVMGVSRAADDPRLTADDTVRFRDPTPPRTAALRAEIARILVRAPRLPVELPALRLTLVDVLVDRRAIELVLGSPDPIAQLRIEYPHVEVVPTIAKAAADHRRALEVARDRVRVATTEARWQEARKVADELLGLPHDVPMSFLRQLVAGVSATGIVRVGFQCNQDCGMCWQGRNWGRYDRTTVLAWIEDLRAAGARSLIISGGEPMLDQHLCEYVAHARALGIDHVTLETNAVLAERGDLAKRLREAGLTHAFVSLHSADADVSDAITRAPGTHARTVRGIRAMQGAGIALKLNAVLTAEGLRHLTALPDFVRTNFGTPALMISYPSSPFDPGLRGSIVPEPALLRDVLRRTIERALEIGLPLEGLDGPCGPPLCAFDADVRVTARAPVAGGVPFRRQVGGCERCGVKGACFGAHEAQLSLYGEDTVNPIAP